jgi:hypothetical protein
MACDKSHWKGDSTITKKLIGLGASFVLIAFVADTGTQEHAAPATMTDEEMIQSAMAAAPEAVAEDATIVAIGADGKMRTLREGTNDFTCLPDNPSSPGPDPMCGDANAMAWAEAWMGSKEPPTGKVGFMYMLAGGTDASNTDPHATGPAAGNNWIETGPHVMIVGARGMMEGYPRDPLPDTQAPYVMWAGTPYEHLMLPVR